MYKIYLQVSNSAQPGNWSLPSSGPNVIIDKAPLAANKPHVKPYFLEQVIDQKFYLTPNKTKFYYKLSDYYDPDGDEVKLSFLKPLKSFMKYNKYNKIITLEPKEAGNHSIWILLND